MAKKKVFSCRTLRGIIKEERATDKKYTGAGYRKQGRQEGEHAKFFEKEMKKRGC